MFLCVNISGAIIKPTTAKDLRSSYMMQRWSRNQSFTLQDNFANQTGTLMAYISPSQRRMHGLCE